MTPKQIFGRVKSEDKFNISFKTIYSAIEKGLLLANTLDLLPRKGRKRKNGVKETRGRIPNKKMIEERSKEANDRRAETFNQATLENFKYISSKDVKTFTSDNSKEFSKFKELEEKLGVTCYFANSYYS